MPGILYHLAFAEEVYRNFSEQMKLDKVNFMAGNLIPDLANDKKASHYRKKASVNGFFVPTMESVKKTYLCLLTLSNSVCTAISIWIIILLKTF